MTDATPIPPVGEAVELGRAWLAWFEAGAQGLPPGPPTPATLRTILSDHARLSAALGEAREWRPMADAPRNGTPFYARSLGAFRFQPYKPTSPQAKRGEKGRWQSMNEYGGWENCMTPMGDWKPHPDFPVPALSVSPDGYDGKAGMHPEKPQQQEARDGRE